MLLAQLFILAAIPVLSNKCDEESIKTIPAGSFLQLSCRLQGYFDILYSIASNNHGLMIVPTVGRSCGRDPYKNDDIAIHFVESSCVDYSNQCSFAVPGVSVPEFCIYMINEYEEDVEANIEVTYMKLDGSDPMFKYQFHLQNTGQFGGLRGEDINVLPVWASGNTGKGITVDVVDDGVRSDHKDLIENIDLMISSNHESGRNDPTGEAGDTHGTSIAGLVAAGNNSYCGLGVAYSAKIAGTRVVYPGSTYGSMIPGMIHDMQVIDVASCSWGPEGCTESGCYFSSMYSPMVEAIEKAAHEGRNGKGRIYVFAGGNSHHVGGDVNHDAEAKLRYCIVVGSSSYKGQRVWYSTTGANMFVVAPSRGGAEEHGDDRVSAPGLTTTDFETDVSCRSDFGGTSASAPVVAGVIALILSENPGLDWRDVQHILAETSARINPEHESWGRNGAGYLWSPWYGFGRVDAWEAVKAAKHWKHVRDEREASSERIEVQKDIPDGDENGILHTIELEDVVDHIEDVRIEISLTHDYIGDVEIFLHSPSGTESVLTRPTKNQHTSLHKHPFYSRQFYGEKSGGKWTLQLVDASPDDTGIWQDWKITVWGEESIKKHTVTGYVHRSREGVPSLDKRSSSITREHPIQKPVLRADDPDLRSVTFDWMSLMIATGIVTGIIILTFVAVFCYNCASLKRAKYNKVQTHAEPAPKHPNVQSSHGYQQSALQKA